jgi:PhnB protein
MARKKKVKAKKTVARKAAPKKPAKKKVSPVPPGFHTLTPHLVCRNAGGAIDFYRKALGARTRLRMDGPDGRVAHAELQIGDSVVMVGEENPAMGASSPETIGGTATALFIYTANVDKAFARAIAAGCVVELPPTDMFWGDRYCKFSDPFGHRWAIATHTEDLSPKEMARRGAEAMKAQG